MLSTKEQERKALAQIKKIVDSLGKDSYIGTAFEGCFEIAEENIENDFACSMKQRAEKAAAEAEEFKRTAEYYAAEEEKSKKGSRNPQEQGTHHGRSRSNQGNSLPQQIRNGRHGRQFSAEDCGAGG